MKKLKTFISGKLFSKSFSLLLPVLLIPPASQGGCEVQELGDKYLWMQSHTDAAWLWRWPETVWVVDKTLNHNIEFMNQYAQYKFHYSSPQFYEWMKVISKYPISSAQGEVFDKDIYDKVMEKVLKGQLIPVDGNWIEPDPNNASGEGLVRQRLYGVRWFRETFGDLPCYKVVWIPDSFGFPHSLPQIYKKSGAEYFTTTKLLWTSDTDKAHFPFYVFKWRSPDGSELLSYQTPLGCNQDPQDLKDSQLKKGFDFNKARLLLPEYQNEVFNTRNSADIDRYFDDKYISDMAIFVGRGDHGEGPSVEEIKAAIALSERKDYLISTANDFFDALERNYDMSLIPVWDDELYVETHRGTYTSKGIIKKMVREAENALITSEIYSSLARLAGYSYPDTDLFSTPEAGWVEGVELNNLTQAWKLVCFNHFHDILPGSSITPVYKDAKDQLNQVINFADNLTNDALKFMATKIKTASSGDGAIVVFNPLSWERKDILRFRWEGKPVNVFNAQGVEVPSRIVEEDGDKYLTFYADSLPPLGYQVFYYEFSNEDEVGKGSNIESKQTFESPFYRLEIDKDGSITGLFDKELGYQFIPDGEAIGLKVFMNKPSYWGAWNIGKDYVDRDVTNLLIPEGAEVVADDSFSTQIDITYRYFNENFDGRGKQDPEVSKITESIILYKSIKKIDIKFKYDWYGMDTLVKFRVPVNYEAQSTKVWGEIPYGVYERPSVPSNEYEESKYEWPAQKWVAIDDGYHQVGLVLSNDGRNGFDLRECSSGVGKDTGKRVLRSSLVKHSYYHIAAGDKYGTYDAPENLWIEENQEVTYSIYTYRGSWRESKAWRKGYELNYALGAVAVDSHEGAYGESNSLIEIRNADHVYVSTFKKAEDDDAYILRLFETEGTPSPDVRISFPMSVREAYEVNLLEEKMEGNIVIEGNCLHTSISPWEIKTIKIWI